MLPILAEDRLIGARIEKCVVERLIGRGGYGLTFLAYDEELREHRVLKVSNAWSEDEAGRKRQEKSFIEEGLILSRLKHPQIVTLRAQGERHGHRYMVLDYIQGFSLKSALDIVAARRAELECRWEDLLDPATATALVLSALDPLEYAHRANVHLPEREIFGVAHRDISPGNLILGVKGNEKGRVVLIDFGTAKTDLADTTTVNHHLVGTVPYMSKARLQKAATPEESAAHQAFFRAYRETQNDIHALGVLFWQLLTGRLPFPGETTPQIIVRVLDPESYSSLHREASAAFPQLSLVLRKSLVFFDFTVPMHGQPYQYPDAGAMRQELEELFDFVSGGRTVQEILVDFSAKLAEPSLFVPPGGRSRGESIQVESAEFVVTNVPSPYVGGFDSLPEPSQRRWAIPVAAVVLAGAALLAYALLAPPRAAAPRPSTDAALEPLAPADPAPGEPAAKARPRKRPAQAYRATGSAKPSSPAASAAAGNASASVKSLLDQAAKEAEAAVGPAEKAPRAADWSKEAFVQLQTLVRQEDLEAYERVTAWLAQVPDSPDLLLLKCQLVLKRNPASPEARRILAELHAARPAYLHPQLFHENALYMLWQTDAAIYESQKTPANRINLLKSANAYLSEFQPQSAYAAKVQGIRDRLPKP